MKKQIAYIIGVFLGDGSISSDNRTFCLQTIDEDFADECLKSLLFLTKNNIKKVELKRHTTANKKVYAIYCSDKVLCDMLMYKTLNRERLPKDFYSWNAEEQKELIAGLLDSEGYVSITRLHEYAGKKVYDMKIGIGACDEWVIELHKFCRDNNIITGCLSSELLKSGKIFRKFIFNKKSFIDNNLYFKIGRKQKRIQNYKIEFPGSTTTRRIPKTEETKNKISMFAKTRKRIDGKFVRVMI